MDPQYPFAVSASEVGSPSKWYSLDDLRNDVTTEIVSVEFGFCRKQCYDWETGHQNIGTMTFAVDMIVLGRDCGIVPSNRHIRSKSMA
jgi:hypothetical protein